MPLTLITIPDDYPEVPDFTVVRGLLKEVLDETTMLFNGDPPLGVKPVECFNHFVPICDTSGLPGNYRIGLTAKGWNYCAIVFELSHELAHVFFHPLRSGAVIESLACAASFEILKRMSIRWSSCSAAQYSTYAPKFLEYQKSFINREISTFPGTVKQALDHEDWRWLRTYVPESISEQDASPSDRKWNTLNAVLLLSEELPWGNLIGIAENTNPPPSIDTSLRSDLPLILHKNASWLERIGRSADAERQED